MRIFHSGDWHIGNFEGPEKGGVNLRSLDTRRCLDFMAAKAEQEHPELVLVSGDIFHAGKTQSERCCNEVVIAFEAIARLGAAAGHVVVMRGTPNHDGDGPFKVLAGHFENYDNIHIVTVPQVVQTEYADIVVLPGFDRGMYRAQFPELGVADENEALSGELGNIVMGLRTQCRNDRMAIFMAHYTVSGCDTAGGQVQMLAKYEPVVPPESLRAAAYDLVALGHIHRPQLVAGFDNVYYCGSINANNFNDEGQDKGFWIHNAEWDIPRRKMVLSGSEFVRTPYRGFFTVRLSGTDIADINQGQAASVALTHWRQNGGVKDKIVRVLYGCSEEEQKAFAPAVLESILYDDGAFWVAGISRERGEDSANRTSLSHETDPEANLRAYLEEKKVDGEELDRLILKARPVIAQAIEAGNRAANAGTFEPVEISVKNYRNYEDETFNFEGITFCTINGMNGAGKSSLFMDAIIDCLYEEPREGEVVGWVRNDASGCDGMIMFTFRIGGKTYRVTRTRVRNREGAKTKTGRAKLNLSEFVAGEWVDRSQEKLEDTQESVVRLVGVDSFTFKSCALIMQDQYDLFLQAKPEERVEVLGTLLGLGIYQDMEEIVQDKAKVNGAKTSEISREIEIHSNAIASLGSPIGELEACQTELEAYESQLQIKVAERDKNRLLLTNRQEAAERHKKLLATISTLQNKRAAADQNRASQQAIIDSCSVILDGRQEIEGKVAEHSALMEREKKLAGESALYSAKKREVESFVRQAASEQEHIDAFKARVKQKENELSWAQPTDQDAVIKENAAEYERQKKLLDEAYEQEREYRAVEKKLTQARYDLQQIAMRHDSDVKRLQLGEDGLKKKAELLSNVECVDISQAKCGFLADAISAKQALEDYPELYTELEKAYEEQVVPLNQQIAILEEQLAELPYDPGIVAAVSKRIADLKPYMAKLETINQREGKIALLKVDLKHLQSNIVEAEKRLTEIKLKATEAAQERDQYAKVFEEHGQVLSAIIALEPWIEKERQLPVAEERKTIAMSRLLELAAEIAEIDAEIAEKQLEADKEVLATSGMEELAAIVARMDEDVNAINTLVIERQRNIGALQQKVDQISKLEEEIGTLQAMQRICARETADYNTLRTAFGQSGVPHQIVRSVIPQMEAISNTILGQMTGGKMGVGFALEKTVKGGKKEVAALDVFIGEHGKGRLPYLSKSGGEKVKASLSVALALAEMKASTIGVQFGMLFIDEPPFLDGDGIQAYCDALETIQSRYRDIKIMAITHDPTMKARFPQNLDVVKTEHGSKVIY